MTTHWPAESYRVDVGPALEAAGLVHRVLEPPLSFTGPRLAVVMLHGRGGDEDAMWPFARTLPAGAVIVSARAPQPDPVLGGYAWVPRGDSDWPDLPRFAGGVAALAQLLDAVAELYTADPARLFLLGFSQGAAMALALALAQPGRVRGLAMLVGFAPEGLSAKAAARPLAGLPIFMAAGRRDSLVPLDRARASAAALRALGADLAYHEYEVGHKVSTAGSRDMQAWWAERIAG